MIEHDYFKSKYDSCVYHRKLNDGSFVYFLLYVDDMLIAAKDMSGVEKLKAKLKQEFEMKDFGAAKKILGMEIQEQARRKIVPISEEIHREGIGEIWYA